MEFADCEFVVKKEEKKMTFTEEEVPELGPPMRLPCTCGSRYRDPIEHIFDQDQTILLLYLVDQLPLSASLSQAVTT